MAVQMNTPVQPDDGYRILGIVHKRKFLQILWILMHLQTFPCIISFQRAIIDLFHLYGCRFKSAILLNRIKCTKLL